MRCDLAPIGLSAYSRLSHLQQTVDALKKNTLSKDSELYVFSDAAKRGDEDKVLAVRTYLHTITGFKKVHILEREVNDRVANNRGGMRMLLEKFGKMIFVEEDAVCAPNFLHFMNEALNTFKSDSRVFAACGYFPPIELPKSYQSDVLMVPRMNAWAFGIWKDRFDRIEMGCNPEMYTSIFNNRTKFRQYSRCGCIVHSQLDALSRGLVDGLDIRIDYTMFRDGGMHTLRPVRSLVQPIGCDGSGEHWNYKSTRYDVTLEQEAKEISLDPSIVPDTDVIKRLRQFNDYVVPFKMKVLLKLHSIGLYYPIKKIVNYLKRAF